MKIKRLTALLVAGAVCASAFAGCALNKNETIATLGDQEIKLGIANFMCHYQQAMYEDSYMSYFGEDVWSQDLSGDGGSMQETVKDRVMDSLQEMYILQRHMDEYKVSLTDEEKESITDAAAEFMESNTEDTLNEMGATQEIVEETLTLYTIQNKMYEAIAADADTEVSDEEANMRAYTYVKMDTKGYYDDSNAYTEYTEEEAAQIGVTAEQIASKSAEDPANFEQVVKDLKYSTSTGTYDKDDDQLDEAVKTALDGLAVGEISDLITTDSAYYVVRVDSDTDEDATAKNRESIIQDRKDTLYNDTLTAWEEEDTWTVNDKVLAKIAFVNRLTQKTESTENTEVPTEDNTQEPSEQ